MIRTSLLHTPCAEAVCLGAGPYPELIAMALQVRCTLLEYLLKCGGCASLRAQVIDFRSVIRSQVSALRAFQLLLQSGPALIIFLMLAAHFDPLDLCTTPVTPFAFFWRKSSKERLFRPPGSSALLIE